MSNKNDYFGLSFLTSIILAIIPLTSWVCGVVVRLNEGKFLSAMVRLFLGFNIVWILDIVYMATTGSIFRLLEY